MQSLHSRMALVLLSFLLLLGACSLWIADRSARDYFLEFTQRLNQPIAMYMAEQSGLFVGGKIDHTALAELADHVMMLNPSVELYLLDPQGVVVAQAQRANRIARPSVSLEPIRQFLSDTPTFPLYGDHPLDSQEKRVFSAHPLTEDGQLKGYVYAILGGDQHHSLLQSVRSSYSLREVLVTLTGVLLLGAAGATLVFFLISRRLRRLTAQVQLWHEQLPVAYVPSSATSFSPRLMGESRQPYGGGFDDGFESRHGDELDRLAASYRSLTARLLDQYRALEANDRQVRELAAGISHDLRTPLTTLLGFLETLEQKNGTLGARDRQHYLSVARKSAERLHRLVLDLFELSQLQAGLLDVERERFSLLELAHDTKQAHRLNAENSHITIKVLPSRAQSSNFDVVGDAALIQRVFDNLLDNAIEFTPPGGRIILQLDSDEQQRRIDVSVTDTGPGVDPRSMPHVFEAHYTRPAAGGKLPHQGLGLTIVERIVRLHGGRIGLTNASGGGCTVRFDLPMAGTCRSDAPYREPERHT